MFLEILIAILILILICMYFYMNRQPNVLSVIEVNNLTDNGWQLYYSDTCVHCHRQRKLFAVPFGKLCGKNCQFKALPAWVNHKTGKILYGYQDINSLMELSKK